MTENEETGGGIFIEESWQIEVHTDGGALVTIHTAIKNVSEKKRKLNEPYELRFRAEESPDEIQYEGRTLTDIIIPTNLEISPYQEKSITIDLRYNTFAKREGSWWDISLSPRYGGIFPHNLTIECYLPMESRNITPRQPSDCEVIVEYNKVVTTFTGFPHLFKLAYTLEMPTQGLEVEETSPESTFSEERIQSLIEAMPLLGFFSNICEDTPFRGKTFLIALHFLKDLIVFLEAFENLGLEPDKAYLFWKPYLYPHKDEIVSYLTDKGYNIEPLENLDQVLESNHESMDNILVLEDGGFIVTKLHNNFDSLLGKTIGAVEQTTKGIRRDKKINNLAIPILNVAETEVKRRIEPPYVADAAISNIENLLPEPLRGKRIALMGLGAIGSEIFERLKEKGVETITVYDPNPVGRIEARIRGGAEAVTEAYNAVSGKFLVIGCSGETSIDEGVIQSLEHNSYLVSVSSDTVEIDLNKLKALSSTQNCCYHDEREIGTTYGIRGKSCSVHLLADGYPVNFWYRESMPNQVSDLILSIIFLSAIELVKNQSKDLKGFQDVDGIVKKYKVCERYEQQHF